MPSAMMLLTSTDDLAGPCIQPAHFTRCRVTARSYRWQKSRRPLASGQATPACLQRGASSGAQTTPFQRCSPDSAAWINPVDKMLLRLAAEGLSPDWCAEVVSRVMRHSPPRPSFSPGWLSLRRSHAARSRSHPSRLDQGGASCWGLDSRRHSVFDRGWVG